MMIRLLSMCLALALVGCGASFDDIDAYCDWKTGNVDGMRGRQASDCRAAALGSKWNNFEKFDDGYKKFLAERKCCCDR